MLNKHKVFSNLRILGRVLNGLLLMGKLASNQTGHMSMGNVVHGPKSWLCGSQLTLKGSAEQRHSLFFTYVEPFLWGGLVSIINQRVREVKIELGNTHGVATGQSK